MAAILSVFHERQTGWHTFTSPQIRGLFLTGPDKDAQALLEALPSTIRALIEAMEHRSVSIQQAESYRGLAAQDTCIWHPPGALPLFLVSNPDYYPYISLKKMSRLADFVSEIMKALGAGIIVP